MALFPIFPAFLFLERVVTEDASSEAGTGGVCALRVSPALGPYCFFLFLPVFLAGVGASPGLSA